MGDTNQPHMPTSLRGARGSSSPMTTTSGAPSGSVCTASSSTNTAVCLESLRWLSGEAVNAGENVGEV